MLAEIGGSANVDTACLEMVAVGLDSNVGSDLVSEVNGPIKVAPLFF